MGSGFLKKKKEAKALQEKFSQMRSQMDSLEVEGSAANGLVTVRIGGDGIVKSVKIKPECIDKDDAEGLQDLVKAAFNDAKKKLDGESMKGMPNLPGLDLGMFGM